MCPQGESSQLISVLNALGRISNAGPAGPSMPHEDAQAASELDFFGAASLAKQAAQEQGRAASGGGIQGGGGGGSGSNFSDGPSPAARVALQALAHLIFRVCPAHRMGEKCSVKMFLLTNPRTTIVGLDCAAPSCTVVGLASGFEPCPPSSADLHQAAVRLMNALSSRDAELAPLVAQLRNQAAAAQQAEPPGQYWEFSAYLLNEMLRTALRVQQAIATKPQQQHQPPHHQQQHQQQQQQQQQHLQQHPLHHHHLVQQLSGGGGHGPPVKSHSQPLIQQQQQQGHGSLPTKRYFVGLCSNLTYLSNLFGQTSFDTCHRSCQMPSAWV